jgi:hypothetical protein
MPDPSSLLGFPPEIVLALIAAYTLVKIVELIVNRKKDVTTITKPADKPTDNSVG